MNSKDTFSQTYSKQIHYNKTLLEAKLIYHYDNQHLALHFQDRNKIFPRKINQSAHFGQYTMNNQNFYLKYYGDSLKEYTQGQQIKTDLDMLIKICYALFKSWSLTDYEPVDFKENNIFVFRNYYTGKVSLKIFKLEACDDREFSNETLRTMIDSIYMRMKGVDQRGLRDLIKQKNVMPTLSSFFELLNDNQLDGNQKLLYIEGKLQCLKQEYQKFEKNQIERQLHQSLRLYLQQKLQQQINSRQQLKLQQQLTLQSIYGAPLTINQISNKSVTKEEKTTMEVQQEFSKKRIFDPQEKQMLQENIEADNKIQIQVETKHLQKKESGEIQVIQKLTHQQVFKAEKESSDSVEEIQAQLWNQSFAGKIIKNATQKGQQQIGDDKGEKKKQKLQQQQQKIQVSINESPKRGQEKYSVQDEELEMGQKMVNEQPSEFEQFNKGYYRKVEEEKPKTNEQKELYKTLREFKRFYQSQWKEQQYDKIMYDLKITRTHLMNLARLNAQILQSQKIEEYKNLLYLSTSLIIEIQNQLSEQFSDSLNDEMYIIAVCSGKKLGPDLNIAYFAQSVGQKYKDFQVDRELQELMEKHRKKVLKEVDTNVSSSVKNLEKPRWHK